jgi:hypothetical protein
MYEDNPKLSKIFGITLRKCTGFQVELIVESVVVTEADKTGARDNERERCVGDPIGCSAANNLIPCMSNEAPPGFFVHVHMMQAQPVKERT